jgi:hypothetical protein
MRGQVSAKELSSQSNRQLLVAMAASLQPLLPEIVFVRGCATGLLITDPAASPVRAIDDVDVIVEIASFAAYGRFASRLRKLGFSEDSSEGAPICRWLVDHMKLDVMPTDERILRFSYRGYKPAIEAAAIVENSFDCCRVAHEASNTVAFSSLERRAFTHGYARIRRFRASGEGRRSPSRARFWTSL